jgi:nucleoid-associated protein YgaU
MGTLKPPGDPGELRSAAARLSSAGNAATELADQLRSRGTGLVSSAAWVGEAARAFGSNIGIRASELDRVGPAMKSAGSSLSGFAVVLQRAQTGIPRLERKIGDLKDDRDELGNKVDHSDEIDGLRDEIQELLRQVDEAAAAAAGALNGLVPEPAPPAGMLAVPSLWDQLGGLFAPSDEIMSVIQGDEPFFNAQSLLFAILGIPPNILNNSKVGGLGFAFLTIPAGFTKDSLGQLLLSRRFFKNDLVNYGAAVGGNTLVGLVVEQLAVLASWRFGVTSAEIVAKGRAVPPLLRFLESRIGVATNVAPALRGKMLFSGLFKASALMGLGVQTWQLARPYAGLPEPIGTQPNGQPLYASNGDWAANMFYDTFLQMGTTIGAGIGMLKYGATKNPKQALIAASVGTAVSTTHSFLVKASLNPPPEAGLLRDTVVGAGHAMEFVGGVYRAPAADSVGQNVSSAVMNLGAATLGGAWEFVSRNTDPVVMVQRMWHSNDLDNDIHNLIGADERAALHDQFVKADNAWERAIVIDSPTSAGDAAMSLVLNAGDAFMNTWDGAAEWLESGKPVPVPFTDLELSNAPLPWVDPIDVPDADTAGQAQFARSGESWQRVETAAAYLAESGRNTVEGLFDYLTGPADDVPPYAAPAPLLAPTPEPAVTPTPTTDLPADQAPTAAPTPAPAPLPAQDATTPPVTATAPPVTGTAPPVTATTPPPVDQGQPPVDQGQPPVDQGQPPVDQGQPPVDQGQPPVETDPPPAAPAPVVHVVQPGDTLRSIAQATLGDEMRWPEIYRANADQIAHPDLIHPGQSFVIPDSEPALVP